MAETRECVIVAFALRFLFDNLDSDVEETLDEALEDQNCPVLQRASELTELADRFNN